MSATEDKLVKALRTSMKEVERLRRKIQQLEASGHEPIAITAATCRAPGAISTPEDFWIALRDGRDLVSPLPDDRGWPLDSLHHPDPEHVGTTYTRAGGFIDRPDLFDAALFGISPREATVVDPQQRILLELTWEALERARIDPSSLAGSRTGVYVGTCYDDYAELTPDAEHISDGYAALGVARSVTSGRISYTLGLQGPAVSIDTACSTSLVAVHLAVQALRADECSLAIAGGATVFSTPSPLILFSRLKALSPDGRCKAFSALADGAGWAEGAGVLVLERARDAIRNKRPILALIRGSAINQDGRSQGLTAPNGPSQRRVIGAALADAGLETGDIDLVEAHGTGTKLGDPIEAQAILATYGRERAPEHPLWLGSVKSNIGHAQAAAGVIGIIKIIEAMQHELLPQTLHCEQPSPHVDWDESVRLLSSARPWPRTSRPRRAAISAFGISGTNAHVVLEEAATTGEAARPSNETAGWTHPIILSGHSPAALAGQARKLREHVERNADIRCIDLASSLTTTRASLEYRAGVVASDRSELLTALHALGAGAPHPAYVEARASTDGGVVFVFPGQGSQWPQMARELLDESAVFRATLEACNSALGAHTDWSVLDGIHGLDGAASLDRVDVVQPTLFAIMVGLAALWREFGVEPRAVIGHSQGEVAAACVAGALSLDDAAKIIALRSRALVSLSGTGAMCAVGLNAEQVGERLQAYAGRLSLAVDNGPSSTVVSGESEAIDEIVAEFLSDDIFARRLRVTYASHGSHVESIERELIESLSNITPRPCQIPMFSTVEARYVDGLELDAEYWYRNLRQLVRFADSATRLIDEGHHFFIEVSPHPVMQVAISSNLDARATNGAIIPSLRRGEGTLRRMLLNLSLLHAHGYAVDWPALFATHDPQTIDCPTYAFVRSSYWPDSEPGSKAEFHLAEQARSWRYVIEWARIEQPASPPPDSWIVVTSARHTDPEQSALIERLTSTLAQSGTVSRVSLSLEQPVDALADTLRVLREGHRECRVISLLALDESPVADHPDVPTGLALTLELIKALAACPAGPMWLLTTEAISTEPDDHVRHPLQSMVWGLGRIAAIEHPDIWGGLCDLPPTLDVDQAERLAEVLGASPRERQLAVRGTALFARRLRRIRESSLAPFNPRGIALITGGTGALGAHVARWLARTSVEQVVLVSRRGLDSPGAQSLVAELEASNTQARVESCDLSQRESVADLFERLDAAGARPNIIIHCAGSPGYLVPIDTMGLTDLSSVFSAKVGGLRHLHELTIDHELDSFVSFGSVAGVLSSALLRHQSPYAMANAFIDAFSRYRQGQGMTSSSIAWGPWADGGMAAGAERQYTLMGSPPMPSRIALMAFGEALRSSYRHSVVVDIDWATFHTSVTFPEVISGLVPVQSSRAHGDGGPTQSARAAIIDSASQVLRFPQDELELDTPLTALGLDSLMGLELRNLIKMSSEIEVPIALILRGPTLNQLINFAANEGPSPAFATPALEQAEGPRWLETLHRNPDAKYRLIGFPYGGGGPPVFGRWYQELGPDFEIISILLPARGSRLDEAAFTTIDQSVTPIVEAIAQLDQDLELVLFGHCMGAILMMEVAERLQVEHGIEIAHVFASAASPPSHYLIPQIHLLTDSQLTDILGSTGFANAKILDDVEFQKLVLPAIRADFEATTRYSGVLREFQPLACPLTVLAGISDQIIPPRYLPFWTNYSDEEVHFILFDDNHYFIESDLPQVIRAIQLALTQQIARHDYHVDSRELDRAVCRDDSSGGAPPSTTPHSQWVVTHRDPAHQRGQIFLIPDVLATLTPIDVLALDPEWGVFELLYPNVQHPHSPPLPYTALFELFTKIVADAPGPIVLIGHGFGAVCCAEIARTLGARVIHLFAVNSISPEYYSVPFADLLDDKALLDFVDRYLEHPQPSWYLLPALRAGVRLATSYPLGREFELQCPITVLRSSRDLWIPYYAASRWSKFGEVSIVENEGAHFSDLGALIDSISEATRASAAGDSAG